jgi:hypothetical protein
MITITAFVTAYQTSKGVFWSREEAEQNKTVTLFLIKGL